MRITETQIVVLCEDGKFRNIPLPQAIPALGERIAVPDTIFSKKKTKKEFYMHKSWIAATFLVLLIGISMFMSVLSSSNQPVAMVAVDINPSVELFVNSDDKVKKVSLKNDDAILIMNEKELIGKDFYQALQLIIMKSEKHGLLDPNTQNKVVMISVVGLKQNSFQVDLNKIFPSNNNYDIYLNYVEKEKKEKAEEMGLSLNKYLVYQKAKEIGVDLNIDDLRLNSTVYSLKQAGIDPQSFFDKKEKDLTSHENNNSNKVVLPKVTEQEDEREDDLDEEEEKNEVETVEKDQEDKDEEVKDAKGQENEVEKVKDAEDQEIDREEVEDVKEDRNDEGYLGVIEFELNSETQDEEKLKLIYKYKVEAEIEKQIDGSKDKYKGDEASEEIEALLDQLALLEDMDEAQVLERILSVLKIDKNQLKELEIQIKFTSGKEIEFEIDNEHEKDQDEKEDEEDKEDKEDKEEDED